MDVQARAVCSGVEVKVEVEGEGKCLERASIISQIQGSGPPPFSGSLRG